MSDTAKLLDLLLLPAIPESKELPYIEPIKTRSYRIQFGRTPQAPSALTLTWTKYNNFAHSSNAQILFEAPENPDKASEEYYRRLEIDERCSFFGNVDQLAASITNMGNLHVLAYRMEGNEQDKKFTTFLKKLEAARPGIVIQLFGTHKQLEEILPNIPDNILHVVKRRNFSDSTLESWHKQKEELAETKKAAEEARSSYQACPSAQEEKKQARLIQAQKAEEDYEDAQRYIERHKKTADNDRKNKENQEWVYEFLTLGKQHRRSFEYQNPIITLGPKAMGGPGIETSRILANWVSLEHLRKNPEIQKFMRNLVCRITTSSGIYMRDERISFSPPWVSNPNNKVGINRMPYLFYKPVDPELLKHKGYESIFSNTTVEKPSVSIHTTLRGRAGDPASKIQLELDEKFLGVFNPVKNRIDGLKTGMLSRVTLARQGATWVQETIEKLGYNLGLTEEVQRRLDNETIRNLKARTPNYPLTGYEGIAYFRNAEYIAQQTLEDPETGEPIWIEGKSYKILPAWERKEIAVNQELAENPEYEENAEETNTSSAPEIHVRGEGPKAEAGTLSGEDKSGGINRRTYVTHGYSVFHTQSEKGILSISEMDTESGLGRRLEQTALEIESFQGLCDDLRRNKKGSSKNAEMIRELQEKIHELEQSLLKTPISLEEFMRVFPPEPPPLATELYHEELTAKAMRIRKRFKGTYRIIPEQVLAASLAAVKPNAILNCPPGGGKTLQAIMAAYASNTHYWWVICPTKVIDTWTKEISKAGFHHEVIGAVKKGKNWVETGRGYAQLKEIDERTHKRIRTPGPDGTYGPEFFIISSEIVAYGFGANFQTHPWMTAYGISTKSNDQKQAISEALENLPPELDNVLKWSGDRIHVWSNRMDNNHILEKAGLRGLLQVKGIEDNIHPCPVCDSYKEFDAKGTCRCGHQHAFQGQHKIKTHSEWKLVCKTQGFSRKWIKSIPRNAAMLEPKRVLRQHPAYKIMSKHVRGKIIDEIHELAGITSQRGKALQQVKTNRTILTTGTLCRTKVSELEAILSLSHKPDSEAFPYRHWDLSDFREDFTSHMITRESGEGKISTRRKEIPEPSNITRLRGLLHGILCPISETSVEQSWGLTPIREKIRYVELNAQQAQETIDWNNTLLNLGETLRQNRRDQAARQQARQALGALRYAHESPEKIEEAVTWAQETIRMKKRGVIVGPSRNMHKNLAEALTELGIPFMEINGEEGTHKRAKLLNDFQASNIPILLTRIRLVNTNYNQLICCQRGLFLALDPSPAAIRQMQKRLNRIGQTESVEWTFLISRLPLHNRYRSILGKHILRIDEQAKYAIVQNRAARSEGANPQGENVSTDQIVSALINLRDNPNQNPVTPSGPGTPASTETTSETTARVTLKDYIISPEEAFLHLVLRREQSIQETTKRVTTPRSTSEIIEDTRRREDFEETIKSILEAGETMQSEDTQESESGTLAELRDRLSQHEEESSESTSEAVATTTANIRVEPAETPGTTEPGIEPVDAEIEATQTEEQTPAPKRRKTHIETSKEANRIEEEKFERWEKQTSLQIGTWKTPEELQELNKGKRGKNRVDANQGFLF